MREDGEKKTQEILGELPIRKIERIVWCITNSDRD